ncbi:NADH dehydrogenase I chain G [Salmonella enterica subsp. enterica]|uniref:NADH dehydrogenase I chain G n=1 Tax=Salmonella enterica I TaxID=59201 RepID=A0A3S4I298_SALET|nr:NADH dehydrogenase I chain G [Salmonella enterica subsp. enterica]
MPQPYIKLNPADAAKLGVNAGTRVSFSYDGNTVTLPVEISEGFSGRAGRAADGYAWHRAGSGWRAS